MEDRVTKCIVTSDAERTMTTTQKMIPKRIENLTTNAHHIDSGGKGKRGIPNHNLVATTDSCGDMARPA